MNNNTVNTYFSAKWSIEVCKSGASGIESYYPCGTGLKNNMILDNWLESLVYLFSPSGGQIRPYADSFSVAAITKGTMFIGSGTGVPNYSQTELEAPIKSTNFIRQYFNECTGIYYPESGIALFSRKYDFGIENDIVKYTEAGFRSDMAGGLPNSRKNRLWSRFVFTAETGALGFINAINSGNQIQILNEKSGTYVDNLKYTLPTHSIKNEEKIIGFLSGIIDENNNFLALTNQPGINSSGYFLEDKEFVFKPYSESYSTKVTGYISGYMDEFGNFSGFSPNRISGISGYVNSNLSLISFLPKKYLKIESITGFISGEQDYLGNITFISNPNEYSGYFIDSKKYFFPNQDFSGFSGQSGFDNEYGYKYSGFSITDFKTETSGNIKILPITGYISGFLDQFGNFSGFNNRSITGGSGFFELNGSQKKFNPLRYFEQELITGFISGYVSGGKMIAFTKTPTIASGRASGYFLNDNIYKFSDFIGQFSGFSGQDGFFEDWGFIYSGYKNYPNSGFSGLLIQEKRPIVGFFSGRYTKNPNTFYIENSGIMIKAIGNVITENYYTTIGSTNYDLLKICHNHVCNLDLNNVNFNTGLGYDYTGLCSGFNNGDAYRKDVKIIELFRNPSCIFAQNVGSEIPISEPFFYEKENYGSFSNGMIVGYAGYINVLEETDISGIITGLLGSRNVLKTSGSFDRFNNDDYFKYSSFNYNGFFDGPSGFSGIEYLNSGTGIITGKIGEIIISDKSGIVTGLIGYRNNMLLEGTFSGFSGLFDFDQSEENSYSGFFIESSGFSGIDYINSGIGILTGIIGSAFLYYKSGIFSGFSGESGFSNENGYEYKGFFQENSGIIEEINVGNIVRMTGYIGYRNNFIKNPLYSGFSGIPSFEYGWKYIWRDQPDGILLTGIPYSTGFLSGNVIIKEPIVGFVSGILNADNSFYQFQNINPTSGSEGFSGVYVPEHSVYIANDENSIHPSGLKNVLYFLTGLENFSGFYSLPTNLYFNELSGFLCEGFDNGFNINGSGFVPQPIPLKEKIIGYLSGYLNEIGLFAPYRFPDGSGYILDNKKYIFNHGIEFSGFSGISDFISGFEYTGFSFPENSAFSGVDFENSGFGMLTGYIGTRNTGFYILDTGIGAMTGIIGWRNAIKISNSGEITGIIVFKDILNPVTLTTGEFLKLRYDVYAHIPAIVDPVLITGSDLIHGEFNGYGKLKLIGQMKEIFGSIDGDGKVTQGNGIWWPLHKQVWRDLNYDQKNNTTYPNSHLSALMIASGSVFNPAYYYNYNFPPINSGVPIITAWLDDESRATDVFDPKIGECPGFPASMPYWDRVYYSTFGITNNTSWPMYLHNTLYVHNYQTTGLTSGKLPTSLDIQMIFPAAYPNRDTGINGIIICKADEGRVTQSRSVIGPDGKAYSPEQYIKPSLYENADAFLDCGLQRNYSAWYYKFDNPQNKYEDQMINMFLTFSLDRTTI